VSFYIGVDVDVDIDIDASFLVTFFSTHYYVSYCSRKHVWLKEHVVPPCVVLVIDDILYGLMVALSYI
jgi:hypothetical protein